jgi:DNA-binding PadR family transcriptional regulator
MSESFQSRTGGVYPLGGLIRMRVLHEPIFGLAMLEELGHHGYRIGPGTLYPRLHGLKRAGLFESFFENVGGCRRIDKSIAAGKKALAKARAKEDELHRELHAAHPQKLIAERNSGKP